jgi:hypothetical protein
METLETISPPIWPAEVSKQIDRVRRKPKSVPRPIKRAYKPSGVVSFDDLRKIAIYSIPAAVLTPLFSAWATNYITKFIKESPEKYLNSPVSWVVAGIIFFILLCIPGFVGIVLIARGVGNCRNPLLAAITAGAVYFAGTGIFLTLILFSKDLTLLIIFVLDSLVTGGFIIGEAIIKIKGLSRF